MQYKKLGDIAEILNGYAFKSKNYVDSGIRVLRIANVQDGEIVDNQPCFYPNDIEDISKYMLDEGDLLVSLTGNVGRVGLVPSKLLPAALNQRVSCLRLKDKNVLLKYLFFYLRRKEFVRDCTNSSKGVAQLNLSTKWLEKYEIPVPSLAEQERIINRIEELFSEIDSGLEILLKTKEQLGVYRQAVLKDAFSRCEQKVEVSSVCEHVTDGDHMPPPKALEGIPFIMISNVNNNHIEWANTAFVGNEYFNRIDDKRKPRRGDVLYTVTGSFGIPVMIDFDKEFCFQRHIALLRPKESILQKFLYYVMMSPEVYSQASKGATGTAQKTVGLGVLRKIKIPYSTDITLQKKIIEDIENKLSLCESIEQTVETTLAQAEAMRQSILKAAFEGRL